MRNRAKCKLCTSVIESFTLADLVFCKCGEIAISGGLQELNTFFNDPTNFLRVDDDDNEILVKYVENPSESLSEQPDEQSKTEEQTYPTLSLAQKIDMLQELIKSYEKLPANAMTMPINYYDFVSLMTILLAIFKDKDNE